MKLSITNILIDGVEFNNVVTAIPSAAVTCADVSKFLLYYDAVLAGTPTSFQIFVEFLKQGKWFLYNRAPFDSLTVSAADCPVTKCIDGECGGTQMRVRVVTTGTTAVDRFVVSINLDLYGG